MTAGHRIMWLDTGLFDAIRMARLGGKHQAFAIARVQLKWHRLGSFDLVDDDRFARPGIHQLAWVVAPRLDFNVVNTAGVFAG